MKFPLIEEFMKGYENDKAVENSYNSEINVLEKGYGPCTHPNCPHSNYELRQELQKKEEEFDYLWEKFREYDEEWERYKKAVEIYFSRMYEFRNNPVSKIVDNPLSKVVTEFIPMSGPLFGWKYEKAVQAEEGIIELEFKRNLESCYNKVCEKYREIQGWYREVKNIWVLY